MITPWLAGRPLGSEAYMAFRRRAIFECCKWDPQVGDTATLAPFPIVMERETWRELASLAESLARETLAAESELVDHPELHAELGLPAPCRRALRQPGPATPGVARLIRFDFHHTRDGWRISEANTDVPGGLNEASGVAALMAEQYDDLAPAGDVAGAYARSLLDASTAGCVALVHATAYTDDHQVMAYLARRLDTLGGRMLMASPAQLRWRGGRAAVVGSRESVEVVARFYPAEWMSELPPECGWERFFRDGTTPISNPATALLTQSKRLPLLWDRLRTPMPTWRAVLPETRHPHDVPWREIEEWVLKPALGRVGDGIGIRGVTPPKAWRTIVRSARFFPRSWIAQRRFDATPLETDTGRAHPCIGVYTVDGRAAGAYGRIASAPLIDWRARDVSVLVRRDMRRPAARRSA
jgi:glutathionylspermidine synthase